MSGKKNNNTPWFLGTIKKAGNFESAKMQNGGKSPQNRPSSAQSRSDSKFSWIFEQPMDSGKYAHVLLLAKYFLRTSS